MKQQARKLKGLIDGMSHTAATELFYSAQWHRQSTLIKELSCLIDSASKIKRMENNPLHVGGRPKNDTAKQLVDFLLRTWELDNGKTATHNSWSTAKGTFQNFVEEVFAYISLDSSVEHFVKDAINNKDKSK